MTSQATPFHFGGAVQIIEVMNMLEIESQLKFFGKEEFYYIKIQQKKHTHTTVHYLQPANLKHCL